MNTKRLVSFLSVGEYNVLSGKHYESDVKNMCGWDTRLLNYFLIESKKIQLKYPPRYHPAPKLVKDQSWSRIQTPHIKRLLNFPEQVSLFQVATSLAPHEIDLIWTGNRRVPFTDREKVGAALVEVLANHNIDCKVRHHLIGDAHEHMFDFEWILNALQGLPFSNDECVVNASSGSWVSSFAWAVLRKARGGDGIKLVVLQDIGQVAEVDLGAKVQLAIEEVFQIRDSVATHRVRTGDLSIDDVKFSNVIAESPAMKSVKLKAVMLASSGLPILITGPHGSGKSMLAKAIHEASGRQGDFVVADCGALNDQLIQSEIFGHVKGAFTGATTDREGRVKTCDGGTIFIDEIGELSFSSQAKLLRVLQTGKYERVGDNETKDAKGVRFIAATNRDVELEISQQRFRADLFYRFGYYTRIHVPPLEDRPEDILPLVNQALESVNKERNLEKQFDPMAIHLLKQKRWPGSVRQLQEFVFYIHVVTGDHPVITAEDVRRELTQDPNQSTEGDILDHQLGNGFDLIAMKEKLEKHYLSRALESSKTQDGKHHFGDAAKLLGLNQGTFNRKRDKYFPELNGGSDAKGRKKR